MKFRFPYYNLKGLYIFLLSNSQSETKPSNTHAYEPFLDPDQERARVGVWRELGVERKVDTFGFDLGSEVRLRDRERDEPW